MSAATTERLLTHQRCVRDDTLTVGPAPWEISCRPRSKRARREPVTASMWCGR